MMRTMRGMAKWLMGLLAFAFVGWMVFDVGMDVTGRGGGSPSEIARVNGRKIDATTFYAALRNAQEMQRNRVGSAPTTLDDQRALENAVLEDLVQQILLREELERRGIGVSDEEIIAAARTSPPPEIQSVPEFQTDGQFDLEKYRRYLAANADPGFLQSLEARYREEIPRLKLFEEVASGVYVPRSKLWQMYRDQHDSVTAALLTIDIASFPATGLAPLTDQQLRAFYNEHRRDFERPAFAYLSYVALPSVPNAADSAQALHRADSLRREVVADGADFADLARRESGDSGSAGNGGDLGDVTEGQMIPEFEQAVTRLRPGQISPVIRTQFGYHIVKLESRTGKTYRARHILIPVELSGTHRDEVEARTDSLDRYGAEQTDPATLDSIGRALGLRVWRAPPVTEGSRVQLGGALIPDAATWAFGAVRPGETSPVIETDHAFYLFRLDSLTEAGVPPFEMIREDVRAAALREQKREAARALARQVAADLAAGARLRQVAERRALALQTVGPFARVNPPVQILSAIPVIGAAFGLGVGQAAGPIETPEAIYFVEPTAKKPADNAAFEKQLETQRAQVIQAARQARVRDVITALRSNATVIDRRRELEELAKQLEESGGLVQTQGF